jgi:hypothetical protein
MLARCFFIMCSRAVMGGYFGGPHDGREDMTASPFTWQKYAIDCRRGARKDNRRPASSRSCVSFSRIHDDGSTTTRCNVETHLSVKQEPHKHGW